VKWLRNATWLVLAVELAACSSSKVVRTPAELVSIDSPLQLAHNWQVTLHAMQSGDEGGLNIAQNQTMVFSADSTGLVSAFKKANQSRWTDQVVWQTQIAEKIASGPTYADKVVLVGTTKGRLIALAEQTGEALWQVQLSSEVLSRPVVADGRIFTRTVDGNLYALQLADGAQIWVTEHQVPNLSLRGTSPVLYQQGVLYIGWETGKVEAVSAESGKSLWETRIAIPRGRTDLERMVDVQSALVLKHDRLVALAFHGKLASINLDNGNLYFAQDVSGFRDFVVDDNAIYVVDEDDIVQAYDLSNGTKLWSQVGLKYRNLADLVEYQDKIMAIDGYGYVHWLDKTHGTIVARVKHSNDYGDQNRVVRAVVEGDVLYMLDSGGSINRYEIKPSDLALFKQAEIQTAKQEPEKQ
jgi:outer membrane protein assembly factor BamB